MVHQRRARAMAAAISTTALLLAAGITERVHADTTYVVKQTDTLSTIARAFGTTVPALVAMNHIANADLIVPGQVLVVGQNNATGTTTTYAVGASAAVDCYTVQSGDTLSSISGRFGVPFGTLALANSITAPYVIRVGQHLVLPGVGGGSPATASSGATPMFSQASAVSSAQDSSGIDTSTSNTSTSTSSGAGDYAVQAGDTLSSISLRYGISLATLLNANNLSMDSVIRVGQHLSVPGAATQNLTPASQVSGAQQMPAISQADVGAILTSQAQAAGLDPALVKALAWQESGWQMVIASDGGIGVMQLMPDTVTWISNYLLGYAVNPYDPTDNIHAGVALLKYCLTIFGDTQEALAAYHQGITSVQTSGISADTAGHYIPNILALQQRFA